MPMKVVFLLILVTLTACVLSYKFGSTPVALAKARPNPQDASESPVPLTLPTAPAIWSVHSTGANGVAANATRPAGGAGVKHVASCISATFYVQAGGIYHGNGVSLLDGSTTLLYWEFAIPTGETTTVSLCDLNVVGSANTAMTLAFNGDLANQGETVNLVGYDAQ